MEDVKAPQSQGVTSEFHPKSKQGMRTLPLQNESILLKNNFQTPEALAFSTVWASLGAFSWSSFGAVVGVLGLPALICSPGHNPLFLCHRARPVGLTCQLSGTKLLKWKSYKPRDRQA